MRGNWVPGLREELRRRDMTQKDVALVLEAGPMNVNNWCHGTRPRPIWMDRIRERLPWFAKYLK